MENKFRLQSYQDRHTLEAGESFSNLLFAAVYVNFSPNDYNERIRSTQHKRSLHHEISHSLQLVARR